MYMPPPCTHRITGKHFESGLYTSNFNLMSSPLQSLHSENVMSLMTSVLGEVPQEDNTVSNINSKTCLFILWIVINNENAKLLKLHLNTKEFFDFVDKCSSE